MYRIGIDVGGTNTDAVILDEKQQVIAAVKVPTTTDIESGIHAALEAVLRKSTIEPRQVGCVMLGTTHATNAIVQRKGLAKTATIRICLPAGTAIEPMFTWPEDLKETIGGHYYYLHGGCEFNGRPLSKRELDQTECTRVLQEIRSTGVESIAVTSVFSPVLSNYEKEFAAMARFALGDSFPISLSSEIGKIGLLERENATILNASLINVIHNVANGLERALRRHGIRARIYYSQNDGTLMTLKMARMYPVLTIGCGPTNSIRGASFLTDLDECIVCDIGGTTTDVGILSKGYPRESAVAVTIGGVRTNFRMPDLITIGIGGGSIVREIEGEVSVGPDSVGYGIHTESIAFGGTVLTATDCLLALGQVSIDHPNCDVARLRGLDKTVCEKVASIIKQEVGIAIDRIKTRKSNIPVLLVGGGSILVEGTISGASTVIHPAHAGCANAVGAAIAHVSGQVDKMASLVGLNRDDALDSAKNLAIKKAIEAGACPSTVSIIDLDELPIPYLPSNVVRIRVKAAGELVLSR